MKNEGELISAADDGADRVRRNTSPVVNARIDQETEERVPDYVARGEAAISRRI